MHSKVNLNQIDTVILGHKRELDLASNSKYLSPHLMEPGSRHYVSSAQRKEVRALVHIELDTTAYFVTEPEQVTASLKRMAS